MYDKFHPFQNVEMKSFLFQSTKYEIWQKGKKIKDGNRKTQISAIPDNSTSQMQIQIQDNFGFDNPSQNTLNPEIANISYFDRFITSTDRLQLITIPSRPEINNMGIITIKMIIGSTREEKYFDFNEPYCCNIFLHNSSIAKLTFSFCNPERLIEFYQ